MIICYSDHNSMCMECDYTNNLYKLCTNTVFITFLAVKYPLYIHFKVKAGNQFHDIYL